MQGVLVGFAIIGVVILVGYLLGRSGLLGDGARTTLARLVFFVLSPALLFTVLADADVHVLFSRLLGVSFVAAVLCYLLVALAARFLLRRGVGQSTITGAAAGYTNANNIGLPVAVYVLGDPAYVAPVILLQLLVLAPVTLTILDITTSGHVSLRRILLQPVRNPLLVASALGALLSVTGVRLPDAVMEPFRLVGAAAVPVVLIAFGISLYGQRVFESGTQRVDVVVATSVKLVLMPLLAWLVGHFVVGLEGVQLFAVVTLAALPTAQNVFVYAERYQVATTVVRDTVLVTTLGSVPVLVVIAALLG